MFNVIININQRVAHQMHAQNVHSVLLAVMECHLLGMFSNSSLRTEAANTKTECVDCIGIGLVNNYSWHVSRILDLNAIARSPLKWQKPSAVTQELGKLLAPPNGHLVGRQLVKKVANRCKSIYAIICAM